ncbi:MAG: RidA family protein [Micrococcales bacterium]|nr:RidA family protein [Micrococcales bacterium]
MSAWRRKDEAEPATVASRLRALGLVLPAVAEPVGAYTPAKLVGGEDSTTVWTSGQLPLVDGRLTAVGAVGAGVSVVEAAGAARVAVLNALAAAATAVARREALHDALHAVPARSQRRGFVLPDIVVDASAVLAALDRLRVVKMTGYVASAPGFVEQHLVLNGASELLHELYGDVHARSAVGVAALPLGAPVEVELFAHVNAVYVTSRW